MRRRRSAQYAATTARFPPPRRFPRTGSRGGASSKFEPSAQPAPARATHQIGVADKRQHVVAAERALEDARRDRDERPRDRRDPPDEDRPAPSARTSARPVPGGRASGGTTGRAARGTPGRRGRRSTSRGSTRAGSRRRPRDHGQVRREARAVPAEDVDAVRERSRCERAAVDHHELAGRGEHRVDQHQDEDRRDAVVGEPGSHSPGL